MIMMIWNVTTCFSNTHIRTLLNKIDFFQHQNKAGERDGCYVEILKMEGNNFDENYTDI